MEDSKKEIKWCSKAELSLLILQPSDSIHRLFGFVRDTLHPAVLCVLVFAYVIVVDGTMEDPYDDGDWHMGAALLRRVPGIKMSLPVIAENDDDNKLRQHALAWLVRWFWAPNMFV